MEDKLHLAPELLEQAKAADSAAALFALAQENGIAMTAEQAVEHYAALHPEVGALSDEELDNVSGGCGESESEAIFNTQVKYVQENYCYNEEQFCEARFVIDSLLKPRLLATPSQGMICKRCRYYVQINRYFKSMGWPEFPKDTRFYFDSGV